ncbi:hypothetical protein ACFW04_014098 [Cataglyphis niger]
MKAAIMCHETADWVDILPTVLGLRTSYKNDIKASAAELVYRRTLRLSVFLVNIQGSLTTSDAIWDAHHAKPW